MEKDRVEIIFAESARQIESVKTLFLEYAESLGFSLAYQRFDEEVAQLPGLYSPPSGRLLLAYLNETPVGCAALRKVEEGIAEMKRLYICPSARGQRLGRALSERLISEARAIGYQRLRLDTVANSMQAAVDMYRSQGFVEIPPYRHSPHEDTLYLELDLTVIS